LWSAGDGAGDGVGDAVGDGIVTFSVGGKLLI